MDERKTKETHKNVVGKLRVLRAVNKKLYSVELWLLNNIRNRNGWLYENLEEHLSEVEDIPILTAYLRNGQVIGDGHNYDLRRGKDGQKYASFTAADAERIVGWIPKDSNIRLETDENSVPWIVADGYLWRWYAPELVDKIAGQGGMEVSIETLIHQERTEGNTEIEERYTILGVTVLGDGVAPAVAGASIKSLAEMREGMKNEILKAASYIGETDEPQAATQENTNPKERKKITMIPTMRQLQEAGKAFEGYTCVGLSEDGKTVALLSAQNAPFSYVFTDSDQGNVIPERIKAANAIVTFTTEDGEAEAALDNVIAHVNARMAETEKANETLEAENKRLSERLDAMEKREKARRLQAAKDAAKAALDKFNA
ncbi:MAG: hypothetical protein IIV93_04405, partial [Clostridia bacterium]|nr:hypothetical protein [Clostridia bacterium]